MREYTVLGPAGEYTVQLSDDEAKARGLKPTEPKAKKPANKQAAPANKSASATTKADG
ncbi:hypothetical protein AB0K45_09590 [Micrococcus luteus]|uniref:hypothetical protein n=1 Tax=Micrococcus luteus TaxID=1270 RepID=UPI003418C1F8